MMQICIPYDIKWGLQLQFHKKAGTKTIGLSKRKIIITVYKLKDGENYEIWHNFKCCIWKIHLQYLIQTIRITFR